MTPVFQFVPVIEVDFDDLLALRIEVMRESLQRIGGFDPQRAAQRFRITFQPAQTRRIHVGAEAPGCVALWDEPEALRIEHFYLAVKYQRLGLGGAVLRRLFADAPPHLQCFRIGALRGSDANRFYQRHGFVQVSESEWDIEYERPRAPTA